MFVCILSQHQFCFSSFSHDNHSHPERERSQRECPQLARVETALDHAAGVLIVRLPILKAAAKSSLSSAADASAKASESASAPASAALQYASFSIPLASDETSHERRPRVTATVWKSQCVAVDEGDEAAAALSQWCGRSGAARESEERRGSRIANQTCLPII